MQEYKLLGIDNYKRAENCINKYLCVHNHEDVEGIATMSIAVEVFKEADKKIIKTEDFPLWLRANSTLSECSVTDLVIHLVRQSHEIARNTKRGVGNFILVGEKYYDMVKAIPVFDRRNCDVIKIDSLVDDIIMAYKSKSTMTSEIDAGFFYNEVGDNLEIFSPPGAITNPKNYLAIVRVL